MPVQIKVAGTTAEQKVFVDFAFRHYKGNKFWVPSFKKEEFNALRPETNPAFEFCKTKFWVAYKDGIPAGRIGGIINRLEFEKTGAKIARFTRVETIDGNEVSSCVLLSAELWA